MKITIKCNKCGTENSEEYQFCKNCGEELQKQNIGNKIFCPQCGTENNTEYVFCQKCGFDLKNGEKIEKETKIETYEHKSTLAALILSLIPGFGLLYLNLGKRGLLIVILINGLAFTVMPLIPSLTTPIAMSYVLLYFIQIFDTVLASLQINRNRKPKFLGIITTPEGW